MMYLQLVDGRLGTIVWGRGVDRAFMGINSFELCSVEHLLFVWLE
jgi:hypothetical protein